MLRSNASATASTECNKQTIQPDDDEDGSMVFVKVPKALVMAPSSRNESSAAPSAERLVQKVSSVLRLEAMRGDEHERARVLKEDRWCSGTALCRLSLAMKLESYLILLKRELRLYQAFDESSGDIYIETMHDDFFSNVNQTIIDVADAAVMLRQGSWFRNSHSQILKFQQHLHTAYSVVHIWNSLFDWKYGPSDKMIQEQREEGMIRRATLERRRKESMDTVDQMLKILGDVEMDEGARGLLDMQNGLRNQWKLNGQVSHREAERMGWAWGIHS